MCVVSSWYCAGIQYLRDYLHLPQEIVPATLKRPIRAETARPPRPKGQGSHDTQHDGIQWPLMKQFLWLASIPTVLPSMLPQLERRFASDLQRKNPVYVPQIVCHFVVKYTPYRVKPFPLKAPHFSQCTVQSPLRRPLTCHSPFVCGLPTCLVTMAIGVVLSCG